MPAAVSAPEVAPTSSRSSSAARAHGRSAAVMSAMTISEKRPSSASRRNSHATSVVPSRAALGERLPDPGLIEQVAPPKAPGDGEAAHQQVIAGGSESFAEADQAARAVDEAAGVSAPQPLGEPSPALERAHGGQGRRGGSPWRLGQRGGERARVGAGADRRVDHPGGRAVEPQDAEPELSAALAVDRDAGLELARREALVERDREWRGEGTGSMEGHEASVGVEEVHGALEDGVHAADHARACREPAGGALAEPRHTDDPGGARRVTDHRSIGPRALGQVASQTRRERRGSPRRM